MKKEQRNNRWQRPPHPIIASIAHDIKAPLTAIKGLSQLVKVSYHQNDEDFFRQFEEVVPRQLERINRLIERLNWLGKPAKLKRSPTQINNLLEDTLALFLERLEEERIRLIKELQTLPAIPLDPDQIAQVFTNLILNAIEAMPAPSKVEGTEGRTLTVKSYLFGRSNICIEIIDTGYGIPPENLNRIFTPFYSTKLRGSGLGLSIVEQIIQEHNGSIQVKSRLNKGTTFKLVLNP